MTIKCYQTLYLLLTILSLLTTIVFCDSGDYGAFKVLHDECPRVHKAWHLTTPQERELFIKAFHRLNEQHKIARFAKAHHNLINNEQAHYSSALFVWHRYFIWEVKYIQIFIAIDNTTYII